MTSIRLYVALTACIAACHVATSILAQTPNAAGQPPVLKLTEAPVLPSPPQPQPATPQPPLAADDRPSPATMDENRHLQEAAKHLAAAERILNKKQQQLKSQLDLVKRLQAEVDRLCAGGRANQTILLHMRVMEIQVEKMRRLGVDFRTLEGLSSSELNGGAMVKLVESPAVIEGLVRALRSQKLLKVLAEPTLVTLSGRPATFHSGGEFPVLVPQSTGTVTIEYKQFGTRLDCLPILKADGRIRLELAPTVSELDTSHNVTVAGLKVPRLNTRRIDTAVEMEPGQTVVLGQLKKAIAQDQGSSGEIALVVTVTADLVDDVLQAQTAADNRR